MSDSKVDWKKVFKDIGEDHVQLVGYAGPYSMTVERFYQAFKQRLLHEVKLGSQIKKGRE